MSLYFQKRMKRGKDMRLVTRQFRNITASYDTACSSISPHKLNSHCAKESDLKSFLYCDPAQK